MRITPLKVKLFYELSSTIKAGLRAGKNRQSNIWSLKTPTLIPDDTFVLIGFYNSNK